MKSHQTTIKDIAKALGISISTVSRALKNHPDISERTRIQVQELAEKLNYKPNALALSLRSNKTNTIGVIIPEIVHHFFSSVISGIEDLAYEKGYNVMVCQSNELQEREIINAQALLSHRVDGVLVSVAKTSSDFSHLRTIINKGIPVVFFDRICPDILTDRVIIDDELGGFMATEHLINCGYRTVAHFSAPQNLLIGQGRLAGYKRAHRQYGIPLNPDLVFYCDNFASAIEKTAGFLARNPEVDGIFAVNDSTAIAVMQAIQRMGKNVPEDIGVVGFGDGPNAVICKPTLTTIEQKGYEMGMEAVDMIIRKIENETPSDSFQTKVIIPNLIIRESTLQHKKESQSF